MTPVLRSGSRYYLFGCRWYDGCSSPPYNNKPKVTSPGNQNAQRRTVMLFLAVSVWFMLCHIPNGQGRLMGGPAWQIANHEFANWLAVPSAFLRFIFSLQCAKAGIFLVCCRAFASLWARSLCRSSTRKGAAIARFRLFHMESRAGCHGEAVASCATVLWRESCLSSTSGLV